MRDRHAVREGYFLIFSLLVLTGLTALTTVSITRASTELLAANRFANHAKAFAQSEAGIECALQQLRGTSNTAQVAASCSLAGVRTVTITPQSSADRFAISSVGTDTNGSMLVTAVIRRTTTSPFQEAVYGLGNSTNVPQTGVKLTYGALADSYNSGFGPYGGFNVAQNGDVRTNSTLNSGGESSAIAVLSGGAQVKGSAYRPAGGGVYQETPGVSITGTIGVKPAQTFATPVHPTEPSVPNSCYNLGNLNVTNTVTYSGTSYCASSITVQGGHLSFPNLQTLYVTNNTTVTNSGLLLFGQGAVRTANLTVTGPGSTVEMTNTTPIFYVQGTADFNNGSTVRMGAGTLRADTLLMNYNSAGPGANFEVGSEFMVGTVNVYTNQFKIEGGSVVNGIQQLPELLRLYATAASPTKFSVTQSSTLYGTIYAPFGETSLETRASVYGALLGSVCSLNAASLHYDEALKTASNWPAWLNQATVTLLAQY